MWNRTWLFHCLSLEWKCHRLRGWILSLLTAGYHTNRLLRLLATDCTCSTWSNYSPTTGIKRNSLKTTFQRYNPASGIDFWHWKNQVGILIILHVKISHFFPFAVVVSTVFQQPLHLSGHQVNTKIYFFCLKNSISDCFVLHYRTALTKPIRHK